MNINCIIRNRWWNNWIPALRYCNRRPLTACDQFFVFVQWRNSYAFHSRAFFYFFLITIVSSGHTHYGRVTFMFWYPYCKRLWWYKWSPYPNPTSIMTSIEVLVLLGLTELFDGLSANYFLSFRFRRVKCWIQLYTKDFVVDGALQWQTVVITWDNVNIIAHGALPANFWALSPTTTTAGEQSEVVLSMYLLCWSVMAMVV